MIPVLSDKAIERIHLYVKYTHISPNWIRICKKCKRTFGNHENKKCHGFYTQYFEKDKKLTAAAIAYFKLQGGKFYDR